MAKKLTSALGVDIGSNTIKVAEVKVNGREPMVTALGIIDTPTGAVDHTGIFNPDAVGVALKKVIGDSGASTSDVIVSVAGQASVMVRTLEVPRMNESELAEHMQWEVSRSTPFAESSVVNDFKPLKDEDPNSPNMDVVMAISPQSAIDTLIACIKKSGKKIAGIDVQPLGIARSVDSSYSDLPPNETICVVDLGFKSAAINVYRGSKLLLPRQVPIGGEMFTQAIADSLTISFEDAEHQKTDSAVIPAGVGKTIAPVNPFAVGGDAPPQFNPFADPSSNPSGDTTIASPAPFNPFADPSASEAIQEEPASEPTPPTPAPQASAPVPQQNPEDMKLYNAMSGVLSEFVEEVRRSIDFFRSRGGTVDRILITGGGSKLNGLSEFIADAIGLPCDSYDPLRRLNINARKVAPGFMDDHRQQFAIAVGNGLYALFD